MSPKMMVDSSTVTVEFSDEPAERFDVFEIVADYDLEGNPVGFEAFDFNSPPWGESTRLDTPQLTASYVAEDNALAVWFKKDPHSSDQETLEAEFGFSKKNTLVFVKYKYERGAAAKKHQESRGWDKLVDPE